MGGLLQNARRFFQGLAAGQPVREQRFSVACPEGHRLSGLRTEGYQSLRCPTCGEGIFVLPRSLLPEPVAPAPAQTTPAVSHRSPMEIEAAFDEDAPVALTDPEPDPAAELEDLGEIEWVDETSESATPAPEKDVPAEEAARPVDSEARSKAKSKPKRPSPAVKADPAPRPPSKTARPAARAVEVPETQPRVQLSPGQWVRKYRNPLVVVAVVLAIAGAVAVRSRRTRLQDLPRIAEAGRVEGLPALDAGKFDRAFQLLTEAKRAVDELGDAYQGASAIRQGADEATIINQLDLERPETLLDEAGRTDPKDWPARFDSVYKGRSIIIDGSITKAPDALGVGRYELDYKIFPDGGDGGPPRSRGEIETTGFRLFDLIKPRVGDRVTFGARLASFRFDPASERWLVGLEKDSGVIMTHVKALEALGWESANDIMTGETP